MAGLLGSSSSIAGTPSLTSGYFNQLIALQLQQARAPEAKLRSDKSDLTVQRGIYTDTKTTLSSLDSLVQALQNAPGSALSANVVTSSDTTAVTASGGATTAAGTYLIAVGTLAKAHRVRSDTRATADQALGLSGTFVLGGAASRGVSAAVTVAGTVSGFGVGTAIRSGQKELGSGTYSVAVRNTTGAFQFRVVDGDGEAASIASAGDPAGTAMTSDWQDLSKVAGTTFDTGRGLTIGFGAGPYGLGAGTASVTYTAKGAGITVAADNSLAAIRDKINAASFADGNGIQASIVNRALVLTAAATGTRHAMAASDSNGTVLQSLGVLAGGTFKTVAQAATDASFTVDGQLVTRSRNAGLGDVVDGVTLNLLKENSSATVTVNANSGAITNKISGVLNQVNNVLDYLKAKTQTVADRSKNTYTRGGLAGEPIFRSLRSDLVTILRGKQPGATSTALDSLADLGIGLDASLHFAVTDPAALQAALQTNPSGVAGLLDNRMTALRAKVVPFLTPSKGLLDSRMAGVDARSAQDDARIAAIEKRATVLQNQLIQRYTDILRTVPDITGQQTTAQMLLMQSSSVLGGLG